MTLIKKLKELFPKCKVWMIDEYDNEEISTVDFELYTNENVLRFNDIKHLNINSILFEEKCIGVEVDKKYFSNEERKQLKFLSTLDLKDYSYNQMDEILKARLSSICILDEIPTINLTEEPRGSKGFNQSLNNR